MSQDYVVIETFIGPHKKEYLAGESINLTRSEKYNFLRRYNAKLKHKRISKNKEIKDLHKLIREEWLYAKELEDRRKQKAWEALPRYIKYRRSNARPIGEEHRFDYIPFDMGYHRHLTPEEKERMQDPAPENLCIDPGQYGNTDFLNWVDEMCYRGTGLSLFEDMEERFCTIHNNISPGRAMLDLKTYLDNYRIGYEEYKKDEPYILYTGENLF